MPTINAKDFLINTFNTDFLNEGEKETIILAMQLFAKGKCKEQRELCSHALTAEVPNSPTHNLVLYAPEPKF